MLSDVVVSLLSIRLISFPILVHYLLNLFCRSCVGDYWPVPLIVFRQNFFESRTKHVITDTVLWVLQTLISCYLNPDSYCTLNCYVQASSFSDCLSGCSHMVKSIGAVGCSSYRGVLVPLHLDVLRSLLSLFLAPSNSKVFFIACVALCLQHPDFHIQ